MIVRLPGGGSIDGPANGRDWIVRDSSGDNPSYHDRMPDALAAAERRGLMTSQGQALDVLARRINEQADAWGPDERRAIRLNSYRIDSTDGVSWTALFLGTEGNASASLGEHSSVAAALESVTWHRVRLGTDVDLNGLAIAALIAFGTL